MFRRLGHLFVHWLSNVLESMLQNFTALAKDSLVLTSKDQVFPTLNSALKQNTMLPITKDYMNKNIDDGKGIFRCNRYHLKTIVNVKTPYTAIN